MKNKDFTEYSLTSSGQQSLRSIGRIFRNDFGRFSQCFGESSEIISRKALAISCILKGVTVFFVFIVSYFTIIHIYNRFDTNLQNMHNLTIRIRYTI